MDMFKYYGLKEMGIKEVCDLPGSQKDIRFAKVEIIDNLCDIRQYAEMLINKIRNGMEEDDVRLLDSYETIRENVKQVKDLMDDACWKGVKL